MKITLYVLAIDWGSRTISSEVFKSKKEAEKYIEKYYEGIYSYNYIDEVTVTIDSKGKVTDINPDPYTKMEEECRDSQRNWYSDSSCRHGSWIYGY